MHMVQYGTYMFRPFFLPVREGGDTITEDGTGLSSSLVVVKKEKAVGCCARKQASFPRPAAFRGRVSCSIIRAIGELRPGIRSSV